MGVPHELDTRHALVDEEDPLDGKHPELTATTVDALGPVQDDPECQA